MTRTPPIYANRLKKMHDDPTIFHVTYESQLTSIAVSLVKQKSTQTPDNWGGENKKGICFGKRPQKLENSWFPSGSVWLVRLLFCHHHFLPRQETMSVALDRNDGKGQEKVKNGNTKL